MSPVGFLPYLWILKSMVPCSRDVYGCLYMKHKDTRDGHEKKRCRKNIWRKFGANLGRNKMRIEWRLNDGCKEYTFLLCNFFYFWDWNLIIKFLHSLFPHQTVPYNLPNSPSNHYLLLYAHVLFGFKGSLFRHFFAFSFDVGLPSVCCEYY